MTNKIMIKVITVVFTAFVCAVKTQVPVTAGTPYTGLSYSYYLNNTSRPLADGEYGNTSVSHESNFHFQFTANGDTATHIEEKRFKPDYARCLRWDKPRIVCCEHCESLADDSLYTVSIFLEDDSGNEYIRKEGYVLDQADLISTGIDFENLDHPVRVGIEITQTPGEYCSYCNRHVGDLIVVDRFIWDMTCVGFESHPAAVEGAYGGGAEYTLSLSKYRDIFGRSLNYYKWEMRSNGREWVSIEDGSYGTGTIFDGSDTNHLIIKNIGPDLYGCKFRCALTGANSTKAYSKAADLVLPVYNPVPTLPPEVTTVPAITPGPGSGKTEYTPSSSSSSLIRPQSSSSERSSSSSSSKGTDQADNTYKGDITVQGPGTSDAKIIPKDVSSSAGSGKNTSSTNRSSGSKSMTHISSASSSSTSSRRIPGGNYVMKNGVLYLVDDEDNSVGANSGYGSEEDNVEESETENPYMASDLAIEGDLYDTELKKSFWDTVWGRLVIIAAGVILLLIILLLLFFGVIVLGEVEEHDEVFELCGIRLMRWHDKSWHVNLGCGFDENAVLKLHIGLLFAVVFDDWDITGDSKGIYEGVVCSPAKRGMLMYRKNIRRSV